MNSSAPDLVKDLPELSDEEKHQRTLAKHADVDAGRFPAQGLSRGFGFFFDSSRRPDSGE